MTAVEFIIEEVECRGLTTKELRVSFEEAKKMEKDNMINFLKSVFQQDNFNYEKAYNEFINNN
jgi:2-oxo-4-hydroxy-4-carboxy--5-ureidoimidazoline (OHCU) decarboxylase